MPLLDLIVDIDGISIDAGPYYGGNALSGDVTLYFINDHPVANTSYARFKVQLWTALGVFVSEELMEFSNVELEAWEETEDVYNWVFNGTPTEGLPDDFKIRVVKTNDSGIYIDTSPFEIENMASSQKKILAFTFLTTHNVELSVNCHGVVDENAKTISISVPTGTVVTALNPYITISSLSTINPLNLADNDFSSPPTTYRVTAEDASWVDYAVTVSFVSLAELFIYDNKSTRVIPVELERGDTLNYYVLISNSGLTTSQGNEVMTITLHDSENNYTFVMEQVTINPAIDPFVDVLIDSDYAGADGFFIIPDDQNYTLNGNQDNQSTVIVNETIDTAQVQQSGTLTINGNDHAYTSYTGSTFTLDSATGQSYLDEDDVLVNSGIPLGSGIDYMVSFHLNNSLIDRHILISDWEVASKTIVWNRIIQAFTGESTITPKIYAVINKDFFTLSPNDDQFWYHSDNLADGTIMFYNNQYEPYIEFLVNKFVFEKVFDNMVLHIGETGIKQIEYWTEDQYQLHEWPLSYVDPPVRPWIDPEFREDKWYFPIHKEEIPDIYTLDGDQDNLNIVTINEIIDPLVESSGTITIDSVDYSYTSFTGSVFTLLEYTGASLTDGSSVTASRGHNSDVRNIRGTYMKVKITFKASYAAFMKNAVTFFKISKT